MLGQMVGIFSDVLLSKEVLQGNKPLHPAYRLMWEHLTRLPRRGLLLVKEEPARKLRKQGLFHINEVRVQCAQDKEQVAKARTSWNYLAEEPENAFLRHFIGAHVQGRSENEPLF